MYMVRYIICGGQRASKDICNAHVYIIVNKCAWGTVFSLFHHILNKNLLGCDRIHNLSTVPNVISKR